MQTSHIKEIARFLSIGGFAALLNYCSRFAFDVFVPFPIAVVIAYLVGMIVAYIGFRKLVFATGGQNVAQQIWRFTIVNLVGIVLAVLVSSFFAYGIFPAIGWNFHPYAIAHAIGIAVPAVSSYFGHKFYTYDERSHEEITGHPPFDLKNFVIQNKNVIMGLVFSLIVGVLSYNSAKNFSLSHYGSLNYPPIHSPNGGSDQVDYHTMAFTVASENFPGIIRNEAMRAPFKEFIQNEPEFKNYNDRKILERFLGNEEETTPTPYAYRPWLYSALLGVVYKLDYNFETGRKFNFALYGAIASVLALTLWLNAGWVLSVLGSMVFMANAKLVETTLQFLAEPTVGLCVALLLTAIVVHNHFKTSYSAFVIGLAAGLCMLAKQTFAPIFFLVLISIVIAELLARTSLTQTMRKTMYCLVGAALFGAPLATYNVTVTREPSLLTGSSGWHDMPSAYDRRVLEGESRFKIREEIFREYSKEHNEMVVGHTKRALIGKKIFFEKLEKGEYDSVFKKAAIQKFTDEFQAPMWEWFLRLFAVLGLLVIPLRVSLPVGTVLFTSTALFTLTISIGGRGAVSLWPMFVYLACAFWGWSFKSLWQYLKHEKENQNKTVENLFATIEKLPFSSRFT